MRVGEVEIERIVEMEGPLLPIRDLFPTLSAERLDENRAWLRSEGAIDAGDLAVLAIQSFLVRTPHHTILIDTCVGNDKARPRWEKWHQKTDTHYMDALARAGVGVEQIDYVMCTHLHTDHVGWNTKLLDGQWVPTFPNARYVFHDAEYAHWEAENRTTESPMFADSVLPIVAAGRADLVGADHAIGDHVRLMPTYGHSPGHVSVLLGRTDDGVVSGDLLHSPVQTRYPDLVPIFDNDGAAAAITRRSFLERFAETPTVCCMTHFPTPSFGRIKRWGDAFRCEMVGGEG